MNLVFSLDAYFTFNDIRFYLNQFLFYWSKNRSLFNKLRSGDIFCSKTLNSKKVYNESQKKYN